MAARKRSTLDKIREIIKANPAGAIVAGSILGPPPGIRPPNTDRGAAGTE